MHKPQVRDAPGGLRRPVPLRGQDVAALAGGVAAPAAQAQELEAIGAACLEFHQALETLYLGRPPAGTCCGTSRSRPRGSPTTSTGASRRHWSRTPAAQEPRGPFPTVLRPGLLLTDEGFVMTELDSVPGGIGLTGFLNRLYRGTGGSSAPDDAMIRNFHASLAALRPETRNPLIALVVSEEAGDLQARDGVDRPPAPDRRAAGVLHEARGPVPARRGPVLRRRGKSREDRRHLPLLRAVRPAQHPDRALHLRRLGVRRRRGRAAHAHVPGGEARVRPLPPPPAPGLLGGGARAPGR